MISFRLCSAAKIVRKDQYTVAQSLSASELIRSEEIELRFRYVLWGNINFVQHVLLIGGLELSQFGSKNSLVL